jgi:hypothetical protein
LRTKAYDIIGDVHGQAKKLVGLLRKLGYGQDEKGAWSHPGRTAIFVGDLIDRGPYELATIDIVRPMVESRAAHCILGNHEFNAIAWATPDPDEPGEYLRRHNRPGNRAQHQAFLAEVENTPRHDELITWFKTLPLWLDFGQFRVVHACWNDDYISGLMPHLGPGNTLTDKLIVSANRKGLWAYEAIETLCKGLEMSLPDGRSFRDKDGHVRDAARIKWWATDPLSFRNSALAPRSVLADMPDVPLRDDPRFAPYRGPPVFFGHYWGVGVPEVFGGKFACVDYSAGKDGPLVAYRWDGETELRNAHFISYEGD